MSDDNLGRRPVIPCMVCGHSPKYDCNTCEDFKRIIKDSGDRTLFETGAMRDMGKGKGRYDLIPWDAIHGLALHCERGALKYGERNVEKGIPLHSLIDSAIRHLSCYMRGMDDEPHLVSALWNIAFAIWTEKNKPEMQDIPTRMEGNRESIIDED